MKPHPPEKGLVAAPKRLTTGYVTPVRIIDTDSLLSVGATTTLERLLEEHLRTLFTVSELHAELLATNLHIERADLVAELDRRVDAHLLAKATPELYWAGYVTKIGVAPPRSHVIVDHVYGPGTGWGYAGISAVNGLSLSTQCPSRDFYAVPFDAGLVLDAVEFAILPQRSARIDHHLTVVEITLLEALRATNLWEESLDSGLETLAGSIEAGRLIIDPVRTLAGAATEDPVTVSRLLLLLALI